MMISTKGRYALRIMIDLAQHDGDMPVSVREIAQVLEISEGAVQKRLARARQKLKRILESAS